MKRDHSNGSQKTEMIVRDTTILTLDLQEIQHTM